MKTWIHLPLAAAVAALVGALSALVGPSERGPEAHAGPAGDVAQLQSALDELRTEQQALAQRLANLPAATAAPATRAPAGDRVRDIDEAIADYMARQLTAEPSGAGAVAGEPADVESAAIAERILSGQVQGEELQKLWQKLRDEKRIDGVLAEIERQAALAPNNPDVQNELGKAYLQKVFDVGIGPMASAWGEKADKAFDRALELDPTHWEARFHKALTLSNAPSFLGKRDEAVKNFEILMDQQERGTAVPEQAVTYLFLGNLYDQAGERAKALATWKRGLARYPDDVALRARAEVR